METVKSLNCEQDSEGRLSFNLSIRLKDSTSPLLSVIQLEPNILVKTSGVSRSNDSGSSCLVDKYHISEEDKEKLWHIAQDLFREYITMLRRNGIDIDES